MQTVALSLSKRGLLDNEITRGLYYAEINGTRSIQESFVLAMSRVTLSDEQLYAGLRFSFEE